MDLSKFTKDGKFLMLALDHRGSMEKLMNPSDPDSVTDDLVINLKNEIIEAVKDEFSALLIDEAYGLEACHEVCQIKPFLLPLEKSSHSGVTELQYSVKDLRDFGASGAKILIDFNPTSENVKHQLEVAKKVADDCIAEEFPLFLEIVTHSPDLVVQSLKMFIDKDIQPNVWKLEYPGSLENCQKITVMCSETPWILLTGGQSYEEFEEQLKIAAQTGVKGFLAGRSLWQEVCTMKHEEKEVFLKQTLTGRFKKICEIILS